MALLNETHAKEVLLKRVVEAGERIQGTALRGTQKVWIWDAYVLSMISWMLMVHNITA